MKKIWDDNVIHNGSILTVGPFKASIFWYEGKCHVTIMDQLVTTTFNNNYSAKRYAEHLLYELLGEAMNTIRPYTKLVSF